jgi:hypothetical protein
MQTAGEADGGVLGVVANCSKLLLGERVDFEQLFEAVVHQLECLTNDPAAGGVLLSYGPDDSVMAGRRDGGRHRHIVRICEDDALFSQNT